jgi:hypothetical protein
MSFTRSGFRLSKYVIKRGTSRGVVPVIDHEKLGRLPNREFSLFVAESASIESLRHLGLNGLVQSIESRSPFLTSREIFRIVLGLCRLDVVHNDGILELLTKCISDERLSQFLCHELSFMAVEIAAGTRRLAVSDGKQITARKTVKVISGEFIRKISAASTIDLSHMSTAVADLGIVNEELMTGIAKQASIQIALFKGPDLADLLAAFGVLGFKCDQFLNAAIPHLIRRMPLLYDVQLLQLGSTASRIIDSVDPEVKQQFLERYVEIVNDKSRLYLDIPTFTRDDFVVSAKQLGIADRIPPQFSL